MTDCLFCKIINNEIPSFKIYEDDEVLGFMDIHPISEGHALIVPKKHYKDFLAMDASVSEAVIRAAQKIGNKMIKELGIDGFNFSTNQGRAAGQEIFHVHFHIIPRKDNDGLVSWPNHETTQEEIKKIAERIK